MHKVEFTCINDENKDENEDEDKDEDENEDEDGWRER